ncbi:hypothetical protein C454_04652 [Haloferax gibbonsii ATCC 33959]|uniref:HhH-GPD domain-containing protein n=1 Tax=Haloferax gibbonsii (strain ATCC 33959 / DSM 4427 / JCM 8863 / NBRC 102184 / NCIMB 2188 / Ma 2.38) TaxID=1227459 RepID=M0HKG9_HALGM|nr:hypothetical protein [Haloferax gibbonsii]ELZ83574.1 hypothetical protein C454_04652 [Haloferax gibbonsii ATCC 33959]
MVLEVDEERLGAVLEALPTDDNGGVGRHVHYTRQKYETIYGITPETIANHLGTIFSITIRQRAGPQSIEQVETSRSAFDAETFQSLDSHADAYEYLTDIEGVGPKIANEYLRKVVHAFGFKQAWCGDLYVPLDQHVVAALVETGCIHDDGVRPEKTKPSALLNLNPESTPRTRLSASSLQAAFKRVAETQGTDRIAFDELWSENKFFLSIPEFREESCVSAFLTQ